LLEISRFFERRKEKVDESTSTSKNKEITGFSWEKINITRLKRLTRSSESDDDDDDEENEEEEEEEEESRGRRGLRLKLIESYRGG